MLKKLCNKTHIISTVFMLTILFANNLWGITFRNEISPRNAERPKRKRTKYIILHTTEAGDKSSLTSLKRYGEAHYMVATDGTVYRIIDHQRIAYHAGTSMWNGETNLDKVSLGIETVGYHNKSITSAQYKALKQLISELQSIYRIPDKNVLTHSMVAYGKPNKWHKTNHRGRKRCGMQFANESCRHKIGLTDRYWYDPDVRAGRLTIGDQYLYKMLYGSQRKSDYVPVNLNDLHGEYDTYTVVKGKTPWDLVGLRSKLDSTLYVFPDGRREYAKDIKDWGSIPVGTKILTAKRTGSAATHLVSREKSYVFTDVLKGGVVVLDYAKVKDPYNLFIVKGVVKPGNKITDSELKSMKSSQQVICGYKIEGIVNAGKSAFDIVSVKWNKPDTLYYNPKNGKLTSGDKIKERSISKGTYILRKK